MRLSAHLAALSLLSLACAGEAPQLRRDVDALRAEVERLERANAAQGQRVDLLAERVASLQGPSPMVLVAPPVAPPAPPRPTSAPAAARPAREPLVPADLQVVKVEPERDAEPIVLEEPARAPARSRKRPPPQVSTTVPIVEPQGVVP